jgi:acid phosphatase (class A)
MRTQLVADCCTLRRFGLAALLLVASLAVQAADAKFSFVDQRRIDLSRLVAPPPSDSSEVTRAELDAMLLIQERRTESQASAALADNEAELERFSDAVGSAKSLKDLPLPLTNALLTKVGRDVSPIVGAGKQVFNRPRPYALEKRLKPVVPLPGGGSFPSGHAVWGYVTALVLADMVPERRLQILARADDFSRNRVIAGVHYPSDVEVSRLTATIFTAFLFASPSYANERAAAAKELRAALGLPAQPPQAAPKT